ncbi:hypothetical protein ACOSP7_032159 [Xanthoceras sorbifolium]
MLGKPCFLFAITMCLPFLFFLVDGLGSKPSLFEEESGVLDALTLLIPSSPRELAEYKRVTKELLVSFKLAPDRGEVLQTFGARGVEVVEPQIPSREVVPAKQVQGAALTRSRSQTQTDIE